MNWIQSVAAHGCLQLLHGHWIQSWIAPADLSITRLRQSGSSHIFLRHAELFAIAFEALVIYKMNRQIMAPLKSGLLSFVMNAASFLIGWVVLIIISLFIGIGL